LAVTTWLKEAKNDDRRENGLQAGRKNRTCHWWDKRNWSCYRERFVAEGAYVFVTGRREKELASAVKSIRGSVTGVQGDVSQIGDLERLFAQIKQEKGRLDIVFANAGIAKYAPLG
jgi:short chain dehydrogenase